MCIVLNNWIKSRITLPVKISPGTNKSKVNKIPGRINKLQEGRRLSCGYLCTYVIVISYKCIGKYHEYISRETIDQC